MQEVIGIRADANSEVAMGHMMRCITVAKQMKKIGQRPLFFTADGYALDLLKRAGMEYRCLNTAWNQMEAETGKLREELKKAGCRKLLVDSYQATRPYFDAIKDMVKIVYVDDCFEDVYPVDMIINYNAYYVRFPYKEAYGRKARLLLGTDYVPLREEFQKAYPQRREKGGILLSSGGGDACDALLGILTYVSGDRELGKETFHVVVGRFHPSKGELEELAKRNPKIKLHYDVGNMAELMSWCDMAVSAAGTVLFELCAMQVPSVFFVSADNQQYDCEFFAKEERMLFAGDIRQERKECLERIGENLKMMRKDEEMRKRMKNALRKVTDGQGAVRIAEEIRRL
mgnify:CR=1 FL=1